MAPRAATEDGHDDAEADNDFGGGDDHHEEHDAPGRRCRRVRLAKVTKVRLTALSISSTHMNMISTLRRISSPTAPMLNSAAASARYHVRSRSTAHERDLRVGLVGLLVFGLFLGRARRGSASWPSPRLGRLGRFDLGDVVGVDVGPFGPTGQRDGGDDGDHEQHRGGLEGEQVAGEDRLGELLDVAARALERTDDAVAHRSPSSCGRAATAPRR